jgi:formylglycine-generating enzyme required for sulfatase activity
MTNKAECDYQDQDDTRSVEPIRITLAPTQPKDSPKLSEKLYGIKFMDILVPETVLIPTGSFNMGQKDPNIGCYKCSVDEQPVHRIELTAFEIGRFEVTNAQYLPFAVATGRENAEWRQFFKRGRENYPVVNVSWTDAQSYCAWLQSITGKEYRLPTEAEWEYSSRAETANLYIFGNELSNKEANFRNKDGAVQVGKYKPNRFGLYDTLGNVWEWCSDWYSEDYYSKSPEKNPQGPSSGQFKVLRGGSWLTNLYETRVANRACHNTGFILDGRGFRVAASIGE